MSYSLLLKKKLNSEIANLCAKDGGNLPDSTSPTETQAELGDLFFSEAKRLWEAENGRVSLTNIQSLFSLCYK